MWFFTTCHFNGVALNTVSDKMYRAIKCQYSLDESKNGRKTDEREEKKQKKEFIAYSFPY